MVPAREEKRGGGVTPDLKPCAQGILDDIVHGDHPFLVALAADAQEWGVCGPADPFQKQIAHLGDPKSTVGHDHEDGEVPEIFYAGQQGIQFIFSRSFWKTVRRLSHGYLGPFLGISGAQ